jgi:monooxygenase
MVETIDVIVVGAGISGIGAGYHLQTLCPGKSYVILEGREDLGGTWDLFRYPGIRSDSDMHTLGFSFKPWKQAKAIADGPSIKAYLRETANEHGIDKHIRYQHRVLRASWDSESARWTVDAERGPEREPVRFTCRFLFMCSGYYDYAQGYSPDFSGREDFRGTIVHPQHWPENLDYAGKRVIVIGSGATAVTLVPELARQAAHVTMLQRSPTYMVTRPAEDKVANALRKLLPAKLAYGITRWKNVLFGMYFYKKTRTNPEGVNKWVLDRVRDQLPPGYDVETHFTPSYNVWDQRLCLVPDSDLFEAIKSESASVATGHIERFTEHGVLLKDGRELQADIIVTATGLNLQLLSGVEFTIDGERRDLSKTVTYKAMMYSGVPNLASSFGYTNASWTLKADLTCAYVCRLLNHMDRTGTQIATPVLNGKVEELPWLEFSSGYVQRALDHLPKQGSERPWRVHQNYALDMLDLKFGKVEDGAMTFTRAGGRALAAAE